MKSLQAKVAGTALLLLCLTACGQGQVAAPSASSPSSAPQTTASAAATTATASAKAETSSASPSESPSCSSSITAEQAIAEATATLGEPMNGPDVRWGSEQADISGFDACQDLSWIILPIVPNETMAEQIKPDFAGLNRLVLFHQGKFIDHKYDILNAETPTVTRQGSSQLTVVYTQYSQSYTSVYTWNSAANRLDHAGEVPPPTGSVSGPVAPSTTASSDSGSPSKSIPSDAHKLSADTNVSASDDYALIKTPSGNIGCQISLSGRAGCGVQSYIQDRKYPAGSGSAALNKWFFDLSDNANYPEVGHKGDAPYYDNPNSDVYTVPYGETVYYGNVVCDSQEEGLTCWNIKTGYGVFMSREGYRAFSF